MLKQGAAQLAGDDKIKLTFSSYDQAVKTEKAKAYKDSERYQDSSPTAAIGSLQDEMVYTGSRDEGATVTTSVMVLRKFRRAKDGSPRLVNWTEADRFSAHNFA